MKFALKTLLLDPSPKKLNEFQTKFYNALKGRDILLDDALRDIFDFYRSYEAFPTPQSFVQSLGLDGQTKLSDYVTAVLSDETIPVYSQDGDFISALETEEQHWTLQQVFQSFRETEAKLGQRTERGMDGVLKPVDEMLIKLHQIKAKAQRTEVSTSSLLFGSEDIGSGHSLKEIYRRIKDKHDTADALYFDLGIDPLNEAKLKDGDLVFFGGFTSHGKSILLRHIAYRQIYYYGRNVAFFTFEMSHDACRAIFAVLHANNKDEYPNTPYISYEKWENGTLSEEEEDFLFNVADYDLRNNPKYGTLYIDQPNKSKFRISDLQAKITEIEATMPIHCVVADYLTLMYPLESDRGSPNLEDYNNMIKEFKNFLITHRDIRGEIVPLLGITAAQISRDGLEVALKADRHYEISAFAKYSEIEKSADHLFTVLMTAEMKTTNQMRLQHLKNRGGAVIAKPADIFLDFDHGLKITDIEERSSTEFQQMIPQLRL